MLLKLIDQLRKCNGRLAVLTPSSRRRLRRLLCRRLHLPLRLLPRLAPVEGGHRQATDQEGLSRGVLDIFCSCPNGYAQRVMGEGAGHVFCVKSEYSRTRGKQNPSSPSNQKWWDITLAKSNLRPGGPHNEACHADALLQARDVATSSRLQGVSTRRQPKWHLAEEPSRICPHSPIWLSALEHSGTLSRGVLEVLPLHHD